MKTLLSILILWASWARGATYTTTFPGTETPISESGNWTSGKSVGLDWSNCVTAGGVVRGSQTSGGGPTYSDSTALLTGTWASNQTVTVTFQKGSPDENLYPEVEIRLRSALSAHSCRGYECLWSLRTSSDCYVSIVKWNGPFGDFVGVANATGAAYAIADGTILKASVVGSTITMFTNGVAMLQGTDTTWTNGTPGIGFDHNGSAAEDAKFGFTSFTATDAPDPVGPALNVGVFIRR